MEFKLTQKIVNKIQDLNKYKQHYAGLGINKSDYAYFVKKILKNSNLEETDFLGKKIIRVNPYSFVHTVEGIFVEELYRFEASRPDPLILDCGSNIGLSILYFKQLYPQARIIGFEPDSNIYETCVHNLKQFGYADVQMIQAGVWKYDGELKFLQDNSLGGMIVEDRHDQDLVTTIQVEDLTKYLNDPVDFLKVDIEGAELEVLLHAGSSLGNVENLFVEYHSYASQPQRLSELLDLLTENGFRYYIKPAWDYLEKPFLNKDSTQTFTYDLQLNIFGYRLK